MTNGTPKMPERISPAPIVDCIADIRFEPAIPPDAVFGQMYSVVADRYSDLTKLPILSLPDEIRDADPELRFKPHFRLEHRPYYLQVGPKIFALSTLEYPGWDGIFKETCELFSAIHKQRILGTVVRIGLRYINFFPGNILPSTTVDISLGGSKIIDNPAFFRTQLKSGKFTTTVQVATAASITRNDVVKTGSIIDLDCFLDMPDLGNVETEGFEQLLSDAHDRLKAQFFALLTAEYVASLNPVY